MVTLDLDTLLPPLFLCDREYARFEDLLVCMWDTEPGEGDRTFTVYSEEVLEVGMKFELDGTRWIIVGRGNGAVARPASEVQ
jgi:hypothetical protein